MSVADQLIAKGEARGEARGKAIGKLAVLQELGLPVTPEDEFATLSLEQIRTRLEELEQRYKTEFKRA